MSEIASTLPWSESNPQSITTTKEEPKKLGTFVGAFIPCILMLFGVVIFLRLGWIVGQAGLITTLTMIGLASTIALITSLSMAAIATNIEVGKGGVYYMLSRSLGIEVGSAVGIPLFLRQTLTVSFCCIGFAESLHDLVPAWPITLIGMSTLAVLSTLAYFSVRGALKVQVGIFIVILASLASFFSGGEVPPMDPDTLTQPLSSWTSLGFWGLFAIFFPAMTGAESSVSLSGDLRDPSKSLPLGTISAILVAFTIYTLIAVFLVYHVPMDRLANDPLIMQDVARIPAFIILGIWGATLSSALGGLLGAPRTLQAVAEDGIAPKIFCKTYGPTKEPRVATLTVCVIACLGIYLGTVNLIAPLLTMISLISYGVLNLSAGLETLMANPSWRPRFRVHWMISIFGALLCLISMLMIDAGSALAALALVLVIYYIMKRRRVQTSWFDIRHGILLFFARGALYRLSHHTHPCKSWRPHFLIFTKSSDAQSAGVLQFVEAISQRKGFLTMTSFLPIGSSTSETRAQLKKSILHQLKKQHVQAFIQIKEADKINREMHHMINYYGLGPIIPNTVVFGGIRKEEKSHEFPSVLQSAYAKHKNIVIINSENENEYQRNTQGRQGDIHIWWDDDSQPNSDLMLVFAYMLQQNPLWKRSKICIKATVPNEMNRENRLVQLQTIARQQRILIDIEVLVAPDFINEKQNLISRFSKNAGIVFLGLNPPPVEEELLDDYVQYLSGLSKNADSVASLALVLSAERTALETILK